jgi:hypothetical protein
MSFLEKMFGRCPNKVVDCRTAFRASSGVGLIPDDTHQKYQENVKHTLYNVNVTISPVAMSDFVTEYRLEYTGFRQGDANLRAKPHRLSRPERQYATG